MTQGESMMMAVVTTGIGGPEKLQYRSVPRPVAGPGEVLLEVRAAGVNNTDINTRLGWYARGFTGSTEAAQGSAGSSAGEDDGGWDCATPFPMIQGADCCGVVAKVGAGVDAGLIGQRVLVRACMRPNGHDDPESAWLGVNFDGAFAEFVAVPAREVFPVACDWSDAELATIPCAYGTAENMLHRAGLAAGERILITGASGGVGSALVQLAKRRGAQVIAVTSPSKMALLQDLGADDVIGRGDDPVAVFGDDGVDVVADVVGGDGFGSLLKILRKRGRYVTSGAIAGPIVALDLRDLYLKDLTLIGGTGWDAPVFPNLVRYIEAGEIRPLVAATYPLERIAEAQAAFMEKTHLGNFVLIPGADT